MHRFFERWGTFAIFVCRFLPVLRGVVRHPGRHRGNESGALLPLDVSRLAHFLRVPHLLGNAFGAHLDTVLPLLHRGGLYRAGRRGRWLSSRSVFVMRGEKAPARRRKPSRVTLRALRSRRSPTLRGSTSWSVTTARFSTSERRLAAQPRALVFSRERRPSRRARPRWWRRVADVRTIVVTNEVEALILEANLIKRHQPPFNVRLRDDKRYPYLKVTNEPFPRVVFTRMVTRRRRALLRPVHQRARPARTDRSGSRSSFRCAPAASRSTGGASGRACSTTSSAAWRRASATRREEDYDRTIDEVVLFLEGKQDSLLTRLQHEMADAAEHLQLRSARRACAIASCKCGA